MHILAIANHKGGVGKTTTAVHLGACLAAAGRSVLLIDCDPQGSASRWLGADREARQPQLEHVFAGSASLASAIRATAVEGLDLVPTSTELAVQDRLLVGKPAPAVVLARALRVPLSYDHVLLDSPPQLGLLACNVVTAAQDLLVPVTPDPLAASVLDEFFATVATLRELLNPGLRTLGIVLVRVRPHLRLGRQIAAELSSRFPGLLLPVQVRDSVRAAEASSGQLPLLTAGASSFVAEDYRRLADLLLAEGSGATGGDWRRGPAETGTLRAG